MNKAPLKLQWSRFYWDFLKRQGAFSLSLKSKGPFHWEPALLCLKNVGTAFDGQWQGSRQRGIMPHNTWDGCLGHELRTSPVTCSLFQIVLWSSINYGPLPLCESSKGLNFVHHHPSSTGRHYYNCSWSVPVHYAPNLLLSTTKLGFANWRARTLKQQPCLCNWLAEYG